MPLYKVVLLGESEVGKSSTFIRFRDGVFTEVLTSTIGLDNATQEVTFQKNENDPHTEEKAKIQLWDTAGLERAGRMTNNYYNNSHAILLMYDVSDLTSINRLQVWFEDARMYTAKTIYFLVGNKTDLSTGDIEVTEQTALRYADRFNIPESHSFRVSAKSGQGLSKMMEDVARVLTETVQPAVDPGIVHIDAEPEGKSCAC